jgi:NAD(P)-dependent dehydrogenase (short-subunit alcohol dehydrogenase family)
VTPRPHTLVIGGSKGIGRTLVGHLTAAGNVVSIIGRSRPSGIDDEPQARAWTVDVADAAALDRVLADVIRTSGGVSGAVLLQRYRGGGDDWAGEMATTLTATRQMLDWAGEHLDDQGCGIRGAGKRSWSSARSRACTSRPSSRSATTWRKRR